VEALFGQKSGAGAAAEAGAHDYYIKLC
jgi:hypothetical protein